VADLLNRKIFPGSFNNSTNYILRKMKYLWAYSIPLVTLFAIHFQGLASFATVIFAFVLIPIIETLLPVNDSNLNNSEYERLKVEKGFDILLYLNVPIVYGLLIFFLISITSNSLSLSVFELVGLTLSLGIVLGANGINVAHELGHRPKLYEKLMAKMLLLPSLYMHFFIEHNHGHHLEVATPEDPSTAKYNQSIFGFWLQTVTGTYKNAWKIQFRLNRAEYRSFFSFKNDMFWFSIIQLIYLFVIYYFFGITACILLIFAGVVGFLLLETINYIEHYGLRRKKLPSGRYERVSTSHSWNSNHILGRIILYELTRHSDHHYKSTKKYQTLKNHKESPQLPFGYPTSMVLALIPPLWFSIMNKHIPEEME
jgi:alkane 1-monooxygenase